MAITADLRPVHRPACARRFSHRSSAKSSRAQPRRYTRRERQQTVVAQALALALELPAPATTVNRPELGREPPAPKARDESTSELQWPTNFYRRYVLGKKLGVGSYGTCYIAIDRATGRAACVKVVPKVRGKQSREKVLKKLAGEADYLMRVQECLGVVQLFETFEDDEKVYFVCELCSGGDLETIVEKEGALEEVAVARVMYEVLKVVATCHSHSLVHGDIKPANFVMKMHHASAHTALHTGRGLSGAWLKAVDFGCSQAVLAEGLSRRTGTPVFMAPEVYARNYGKPADLWSCGIMMYQLVAKRFPFWETYEECRSKALEEVVTAVAAAPIPLAGASWLPLSPLGMDFLSKLLTRNASARLTAPQALEHPWFRSQLGWPDVTCSESASYASEDDDFFTEINNILPLGHLPTAAAPHCTVYNTTGLGGVQRMAELAPLGR